MPPSDLPLRLDDLIAHVLDRRPDGAPLDHLADAVVAAEHVGEVSDHLVGHFVDQARRSGASWTDIGEAMGVSKQAAQQRFVLKVMSEPRPTGQFARFTVRARSVVEVADERARQAGHEHVGTEHLLLGLVADPGSIASLAIVAQGVSLDAVARATTALLGPATAPTDPAPEHVPFSPRAKKLFELCLREALRRGHNYVGTEHILLAMLDVPTTSPPTSSSPSAWSRRRPRPGSPTRSPASSRPSAPPRDRADLPRPHRRRRRAGGRRRRRRPSPGGPRMALIAANPTRAPCRRPSPRWACTTAWLLPAWPTSAMVVSRVRLRASPAASRGDRARGAARPRSRRSRRS